MEGAKNGFTDDREQELLKAVLLLKQANCVTRISALFVLFVTGWWVLKKKKSKKYHPLEVRKNAI